MTDYLRETILERLGPSLLKVVALAAALAAATPTALLLVAPFLA